MHEEISSLVFVTRKGNSSSGKNGIELVCILLFVRHSHSRNIKFYLGFVNQVEEGSAAAGTYAAIRLVPVQCAVATRTQQVILLYPNGASVAEEVPLGITVIMQKNRSITEKA